MTLFWLITSNVVARGGESSSSLVCAHGKVNILSLKVGCGIVTSLMQEVTHILTDVSNSGACGCSQHWNLGRWTSTALYFTVFSIITLLLLLLIYIMNTGSQLYAVCVCTDSSTEADSWWGLTWRSCTGSSSSRCCSSASACTFCQMNGTSPAARGGPMC